MHGILKKLQSLRGAGGVESRMFSVVSIFNQEHFHPDLRLSKEMQIPAYDWKNRTQSTGAKREGSFSFGVCRTPRTKNLKHTRVLEALGPKDRD